MTNENSKNLRIAIQKKGRLFDASEQLLKKCGITFKKEKNQLISTADNFPIDIVFVRDDDIPDMVSKNGICDLGVIGQNELFEKQPDCDNVTSVIGMNEGTCRLSIATPAGMDYQGSQSLNGKKIATSYPEVLEAFLKANNIDAEIINMAGSVEVAPVIGMADAICDLVSSGRTLKENNLVERDIIMESQAVIIQNKNIAPEKQDLLNILMTNIQEVLKEEVDKPLPQNMQQIINKPQIETVKSTPAETFQSLAQKTVNANTAAPVLAPAMSIARK